MGWDKFNKQNRHVSEKTPEKILLPQSYASSLPNPFKKRDLSRWLARLCL